jgi:hypothetical protein
VLNFNIILQILGVKMSSPRCIISILFFFFAITANAQSYNYNDSPNNYQNSINNYDNSPNNYRNSPHNYENSPNNFSSTNGVYDNNGNRIGYKVQAPSGVTNIFSNDGQRMGYEPANQ